MTYITIESHSMPQTKETSIVRYFVDMVENNAHICIQSFPTMQMATAFANKYSKKHNMKIK